MDSEFNIGQTVRLNSGGPIMTIESLGSGVVNCMWFEDAHLRSASFRRAVLRGPIELIDDDLQTYGVDNFG